MLRAGRNLSVFIMSDRERSADAVDSDDETLPRPRLRERQSRSAPLLDDSDDGSNVDHDDAGFHAGLADSSDFLRAYTASLGTDTQHKILRYICILKKASKELQESKTFALAVYASKAEVRPNASVVPMPAGLNTALQCAHTNPTVQTLYLWQAVSAGDAELSWPERLTESDATRWRSQGQAHSLVHRPHASKQQAEAAVHTLSTAQEQVVAQALRTACHTSEVQAMREALQQAQELCSADAEHLELLGPTKEGRLAWRRSDVCSCAAAFQHRRKRTAPGASLWKSLLPALLPQLLQTSEALAAQQPARPTKRGRTAERQEQRGKRRALLASGRMNRTLFQAVAAAPAAAAGGRRSSQRRSAVAAAAAAPTADAPCAGQSPAFIELQLTMKKTDKAARQAAWLAAGLTQDEFDLFHLGNNPLHFRECVARLHTLSMVLDSLFWHASPGKHVQLRLSCGGATCLQCTPPCHLGV